MYHLVRRRRRRASRAPARLSSVASTSRARISEASSGPGGPGGPSRRAAAPGTPPSRARRRRVLRVLRRRRAAFRVRSRPRSRFPRGVGRSPPGHARCASRGRAAACSPQRQTRTSPPAQRPLPWRHLHLPARASFHRRMARCRAQTAPPPRLLRSRRRAVLPRVPRRADRVHAPPTAARRAEPRREAQAHLRAPRARAARRAPRAPRSGPRRPDGRRNEGDESIVMMSDVSVLP